MWKEGGCESGIGLHGLINGLNCFEESTIAHAKHCRPRVGEILSLLIKWKMQIESVLHSRKDHFILDVIPNNQYLGLPEVTLMTGTFLIFVQISVCLLQGLEYHLITHRESQGYQFVI